jgi:hypothetical protein
MMKRMATLLKRRTARAQDLGLTRKEFALLKRLDSPQKIQAFLNAVPINHEADGETVLAVREVLGQRRAHCIEGAFLAAAALWANGEPPLVMHLDCDNSDFPHVITLFRRSRYWGAISKTNGLPLRFRDPVYRSLREVALSYFHEYFDKRGRKTLRSYTAAFDMRKIDPALWVTGGNTCWEAHDRLAALRHYDLVSASQLKQLTRRDLFEMKMAKNVEYPRPAQVKN